ncbi:hypothetical protein H1235_14670 [Pseudoxanthomonas sp. NC8]|nr:hypothetical protein H1235_14670 [Pseudoxanthomonas sp. NC8]
MYRPGNNTAKLMVERLIWNDRIARALDNGLLQLHFWGIYHAGSGELAHWKHWSACTTRTAPAS